MQVEVLRKGSKGLQGTIANIAHHARPLADLVTKLTGLLELYKKEVGFSRWAQGSNVHLFETLDGRRFVVRPLHVRGEGYIGLTLALRLSRSNEIHLMTIYADCRNHLTPDGLVNALQWLGEVEPTNLPSSEEN